MSECEILIVIHFGGQLEWNKGHPKYSDGDQRTFYVSSSTTYNSLIKMIYEATNWILQDEHPLIQYLHQNGRAFTLITIKNDGDIHVMFKACGAESNSIYIYASRNYSRNAENCLSLSRSPKEQIKGPGGRKLQLQIQSRLSLTLFTGEKVAGEKGAAIIVELIDESTGDVVTSGPESSAKLDVVVLEGDFNDEDDDDWTLEDFESHEAKERKGKGPLLTGDLKVSLKEGVGLLGGVSFTDNSCWMASKKFILGFKVAPGFCEGIRVREAKSNAFKVKDRRGKYYEKHYPPTLKDEVWRLDNIRKDGPFHIRLSEAGIHKVKDFLVYLDRDREGLREIFEIKRKKNKEWDALVEHAKTCVFSEQHVSLAHPSSPFLPEQVSPGLAVGDNLVSSVQQVSQPLLPSSTTSGEAYLVTSEQQVSQQCLSGLDVGGVMGDSQCSNAQMMLKSNSFGQQIQHSSSPSHESQITRNFDMIGSASCDGFQFIFASDLSSHYDQSPAYNNIWGDNNPGEEEINRWLSQEMLENDEPQHQIFFSSMGEAAPFNEINNFNSGSSTYKQQPSMNFISEEDRSSSGKAGKGFLKIKAALIWGIFIRNKAAKKRAQLVELG